MKEDLVGLVVAVAAVFGAVAWIDLISKATNESLSLNPWDTVEGIAFALAWGMGFPTPIAIAAAVAALLGLGAVGFFAGRAIGRRMA